VTYTPEDGYYGFSKVVVGGVDPGGGGGSSGGGGGEVITYPSAEGITFGTEAVTEEVETGNFIYGDAPPLPAIPDDPEYPYKALSFYNNTYQVNVFAAPPGEAFYYEQPGYANYTEFKDFPVGTKTTSIYLTLTNQELTWTWSRSTSTTVNAHSTITIYGDLVWCNFPVPFEDETVEYGEAVPETGMVTTDQPLDRDESYLISGEDLNSIIGIAQKVTGTTKPMTVEEATKALTDYGVRPSAEEEGF
jgi:hypothetical protein